jgi:uncharacterized cupredoxin-like copper-binding protein
MTTMKFMGISSVRAGLLGLLGVALLLGLAACGSTDVANPPAAAPTATTGTQSADMPAMTDTPMAAPTTDSGAAAAPTPADGTGAGTSSGGTDVQATLKEWAIELSQAEVAAGTVRFTVTNAGTMPHNLTVTQNGATLGATSTFGPAAGPQTLEVTLQPGTYTLICSLPGHAQRGQRIDLVVK